MFCVECGKEGEPYKNGLCVECYLKQATFTSCPQYLDLYQCSKCSAYKHKNVWLAVPLTDVLLHHLKDKCHISGELDKVRIEPICPYKDKTRCCVVHISGKVQDHDVKESHEVTVRLKNTVCDVCSKQFGGYYEDTIQIRADRRQPSHEELSTIESHIVEMVDKMREKGNSDIFITDVAEEKGGIDIYLSEKGAAHTIAKKIQDHFGGEIKQSSKNVGMKDSKQVYRMTYLVRLPGYQQGDVLSHAGSTYYVQSIQGTNASLVNLSTWEKQTLDGKELHKATVVGSKDLIKEMIFVSQSQNELQVMDPKTYKMFEVRKPQAVSFKKKAVKIVKIENNIFLFPEKNIIDK